MVEGNASFKTLVYIVTYKEPGDKIQQEKMFFTRAAANDFALTVELMGGVAVITEELEEGV